MKKTILLLSVWVIQEVHCQVGINTVTPYTTLDVTAKTTDGSRAEGVIAPRLTGDQIKAGDAQYTANLRGNIIYATSAVGIASPKTVNITAAGYYFFDGSVWQKLNDGSLTSNIYNNNGTLTANRTVTMADKTLSFTTAPTAGTSHFNVNGGIFSIDALNKRVGIGTAAPAAALNIVGGTGSTTNLLSVGIDNCGAPCAQGTARNIVLYNADIQNPQFASIDFLPGGSPNGLSGASMQGIDRDPVNDYAGFQFLTRNATDYAPRMTIRSSGLVGINTTTPGSRLEVNGSITNTVAFNAGAATTIDFSRSNLAYTTASPGAFTLTNIKDGGNYTLAVRGAVIGISTFTAAGFTVRYANNTITILNAHTLYNFIVQGSVVYVYTTAGFL
ncbi:hypothetical protein [Chryseobacterium sp.]|uniref:hypothetical protein n=1 Tax=Chryseobacterium sp. TaxID=1871047 RepID=UPI002FC8661B